MRSFIRTTVALGLSVILLTLPLATLSQINRREKPSLFVETTGGLTMARIVTPEGVVRLNLPDDMAAGDTISGTVSVEPNGNTEAEKVQNQGMLNGYVIDLGDGTKVPADKPQFTWLPQIPQPNTASKYSLKLIEVLGMDGQAVASANIQILNSPPPAPSAVEFPPLGQTGRPISIPGPFDGNSSTTGATIGGRDVPIIAESPRKVIVEAPVDITGPTGIEVNDGATKARGMIRIVGVGLSAPKTNLTKGEKTTLTVNVTGLQGITTPVPLNIVTTGTVNMDGGNMQTLLIQPNQVNFGGTFTQTYGLTGTQAGVFNVVATVVAGGQRKGCNCKCEFADPPIVTAGKARAPGGGTRNGFEPNMKNASCTGNQCSVSKIDYSWSIGAGSTATYTVAGVKTAKKLEVDVTKDGTLELTVTVTVTCSDGTTCTATGSKTFAVKAK